VNESKPRLGRHQSDDIVHRLGTFRSASPGESLKAARVAAKICGISRLASVTGLDHIGLPVWMAIRPLGRSLSVSQGKGLTDTLAQVSALMEAIELFHAESFLPAGIERSIKLTARDPNFADVEALPIHTNRDLNFESPIRWLETRSIITGKTKWIPKELIDLDTTRIYDGFFVPSSNGLASGNSRTEALLHGLSEILERDQVSHWLVVENLSPGLSCRRLNLSSGLPESIERAISMIRQAGLAVAVWYAAVTMEVPCFVCAIADTSGNTLYPQHAAGYGCHISKEIALLRAITEAAQSRLTFISGTRDDLFVRIYENDIRVDAPSNRVWLQSIQSSGEDISYNDLPDFSHFITFSEAVEYIASCMLDDGITDVLALDLTNDTIGVPVIHVVAPHAEFDVGSAIAEPGLRLCSFLKTQNLN
jgi:YcaO-like protein with predicted kinase domain